MKITFTGFGRALGPPPPGSAAWTAPSERLGLAGPRREPPVLAPASGISKVHWFVPTLRLCARGRNEDYFYLNRQSPRPAAVAAGRCG
jgi:hypothetical protein